MNDDRTRVLWTSNNVLPAVAKQLGLQESPFEGWLPVTTERLALQQQIRIGIAMRSPVRSLQRIDQDGISYFAMPHRRTNIYDVNQADCDRVLADFAPDILHAEGTEMAYTRRFLKSWFGSRLISLQGVINGHAAYQFGNLSFGDFVNWRRPSNAAVGLALYANYHLRFRPRLKAERETLGMTDHILGRTIWDKAQAYWLNPVAEYHHCPRILRAPFYDQRWTSDRREEFSVFLGNSASALKGAHVMLHALAQLKLDFPQARVYIAGRDPFRVGRLSAQGLVGYSVYLRNLIEDLGLKQQVIFTGQLNAEQMAARMSRSHVYVLTSLIENSPNTLAEAMLMGVPSVVAYTGGVPSMAKDEHEVLMYRAGDPAFLAYQIQRLFRDHELCQRLSRAARDRASQTHDPDAIIDTLVSVYCSIRGGCA